MKQGSYLPWARLLRLPNLPTAALDVIAGAAYASAGSDSPFPWESVCLVAGSALGIYSAGFVLNDFADRKEDKIHAPERPIPNGEISPRSALTLGLFLWTAGACLAFFSPRTPCLLLLAAAGLSLAYNFVWKKSVLLGPITLAICRICLFLSGASLLATEEFDLFRWAPPSPIVWSGFFGGYVLALSFFARMEDSEVRPPRARILLSIAMGIPLVLSLAILGQPIAAALLVLLVLTLGLAWSRALGWSQASVRKMTGSLLMGLYFWNAAAASVGFGWSGCLFLLPWPIAQRLRKTISPS